MGRAGLTTQQGLALVQLCPVSISIRNQHVCELCVINLTEMFLKSVTMCFWNLLLCVCGFVLCQLFINRVVTDFCCESS